MVDFFMVSTRSTKNGGIEIFPKFIINNKSKDLMIRGGDFYAIWLEDKGLWSTEEDDVIQLIDRELDAYYQSRKAEMPTARVLHMWDADSGSIDKWHKYCQKQCRDSFHMLDENLIFSNFEVKKTDYASKMLSYPLEPGDYSSYDKLIGTLYSPEERKKIEWAIGSVVAGDSKKIQKFLVFYGEAGTGKSTILNIIEQLFDGYWSAFDAKALGSSTNVFALEAFKTNPLVAIQHDGDLSRIEDNTRLNSLVSHETMTVNEKYKSTYANRFKAFLFLGTNKPVKITDAKSGLLRRLIDVTPSGNLIGRREYAQLVKNVKFELGAIASHCLDIYLSDPGMFDDYIPINMLEVTNDFYNFMVDGYYEFKKADGITLKAAWERYKTFCDDTKTPYPLQYRIFREEFKAYWEEYEERKQFEDGSRVRSWYSGFRVDKFEKNKRKVEVKEEEKNWIVMQQQPSRFDAEYGDCPAQLSSAEENRPMYKWSNCKTTLRDIDTSKLHYVKVPENHIIIDFDIPGDDGNKSLEKNLAEAAKWPPTYAELSKSGAGIHLHYIYQGDVSRLADHVSEHVEVKVAKGNASLRRKLTLCTNLAIATISSGLPLRKERKVATNQNAIKDEKNLRSMIEKNFEKEFHGDTSSSINFIKKLTDDSYESGMAYDIRDMKNALIAFAQSSTHQSKRCLMVVDDIHLLGKPNEEALKEVGEMVYPSIDVRGDSKKGTDGEIIFFDVEVFPNLFVLCWKKIGAKDVNRMINPTSEQIEGLLQFKLVGFNCRRYDNHILYARLMGYNNKQLYNLSQKIISGDKKSFFSEAYNLSYTDIYDFANGDNKTSLKKLEIKMGIHHDELGIPWDKPVPEWAYILGDHWVPASDPEVESKESHAPQADENGNIPVNLWDRVAEYCCNDVNATEEAFNYLNADWTARQILADITGMTVNDTSNSLTTRLIFGKERNTQSELNWRDLGDMSKAVDSDLPEIYDKEWTVFDADGRPIFPGYKYELGKSSYRGENPSEGGYVYAEPGMYGNVALLDIASMHPSSIIAEELFGKYTENYEDLVTGRLNIKHQNWEELSGMFGGKLEKYIQKVKDGEMTSKQLANAIKIPINSVYGLTSASFSNPFKDDRNVDNIVAKRGALFMINLKHEVQRMGYKVAHIKTDSIKIPDATPEIIEFVMEYGKLYGYTFEHEATYERMCLINDAVYIAKYADGPHKFELPTGEVVETPWTATGTEFQVPYIFKTLFSKDPVSFRDLCVTNSVTSALYLDMNEGYPDVSLFEKEYKKLQSKYKKGELSDTTWESEGSRLVKEIEKGHNYIFIGKVGQFCPVIEGSGGGLLMREKDGKYYSVSGTKGTRWKESELIKGLGLEKEIDMSYFETQAHNAMGDIMQFGDYTWFVSEDPYVGPDYIPGEDMSYPNPEFYKGDVNFAENFMNEPEDEQLPWALEE